MADSIEKRIDLSLDELIKQRKKESKNNQKRKETTVKQNRGAVANGSKKAKATAQKKTVTRQAQVNKNRGMTKPKNSQAALGKNQTQKQPVGNKKPQQQQQQSKANKKIQKKKLGNAAKNLQQVGRTLLNKKTLSKNNNNKNNKFKAITTTNPPKNNNKSANQPSKPRQVKTLKGPKLQITIKRKNHPTKKPQVQLKTRVVASSVKGKVVQSLTNKPLKKPVATSKKVTSKASKSVKFAVRKPFAARRK